MAGGGLQAQPLSNHGQFNWIFLIWILVDGILAVFFLFYFNRLFAAVVSYAIRSYTWYKFRAYIDISALQISLLGGRVFFKSIRYHAHNLTVYVYDGHVTWRYWLPRVQAAEVFQHPHVATSATPRASSTAASERDGGKSRADGPRARSSSIGQEEKGGVKPKTHLPCRISAKVTGVEAFIYNRSPLYDAVVDATMRKAKGASKEDRGGSQSSSGQGSNSQRESKLDDEPQKLPTRTTAADAAAPEKSQIPAFLRIFPIKIECKRAAAALGNENTTNVLTAKAERAVGTVDAGHAGPLDLWKLLFDFSIEKVKVAMRPNKDFKEFQLRAGQRLLQEKELAPPEPEMKPVKEAVEKTRGVWFRLRRFFHRHSSSTDSLRTASIKLAAVGRTPREQPAVQSPWNGLARYLDERDLNEHEEWQNVEYAKVSDLVDCDKVTMRFYWDMSGPLPNGMLDSDTLLGSEYEDDINGTAPPEYGMDLGVYGGVVQYGPWADRQRINLQQIFFPAPYVDAVPAQPLQPGELRVCTVFKIKVVVEEDVILRVPTREESKDSKWKGRADKAQPAHVHGNDANRTGRHWRRHRPGKRKNKKAQAAIDARPFGWLDVTVKKDSVVNYIMDMFPRSTGYRNNLDIDVKGVEMQSSVNHGLLWRSGPVSVQADISQPIEWNTLRKWPFQIVINDLELFILRDHLFLIIDLVNDWSSGAPSEFWNFVPYNYQLDMTFRNFVMYLNVNDANIINDPADFDRNDFLTLEGQLHAVLGIPMEYYRPKSNTITFDVLAQDLSMRQCSPPKSTFSVYVEDKTMAILPKLSLTGSYAANQEAKVGNVDVLRMDIVGTGLSLKAFGFYVRQLVSVQENYFGDYMHFKTLEEFQAAGDDLEEANAKTASFPKPTSINELDVILCIVAEEATVMFPTNLYSCKEFVRAELPRADLDLRIASYYLDMGLQLSPLSFMTGVTTTDEEDEGDPVDTESSTQFWVAHVDLNGHRAFGLPPNEDAYVSQWDIDIGKITGEMSSKFVRDLALAGRAFAFSIQDAENALPVRSPAVALDASFVQVRTDNVRLWMHVGKDALLMDLDPVTVDVCDWASSWFSQRVNVLVPLITFACVDGRSASRHRSPFVEKKPVRTHAFLQTGLSLDVVGRKLNFGLETKRQQAHLKLHDRRTGRFPFLIRTNIDAPVDPEDGLPFEAPAMPYPPMPAPLAYDGKRALSVRSSSTTLSRMQSPYESSRSSLAGSIRNGRPLSTAPQRPAIHKQPSEKSGSRPSTAFDMAGASSRSSSTDAPLPDRGDEILPNDAERAKSERPASTMAFSSLYSEPYFPLELTIPDETNVPRLPRVMDDPDEGSVTSTISQYIDNPDFDRNAERVTVLIKVIPGIRAYVEPHMAVTVANLIEKVLPRSAEEVMDSFQMSVMGAIAAHNAERIGPNKVLEINASLAQGHIRVDALEEHKDEIADQIDVALGRLEVSARVRTEPRDEGALQFLALHTLLGNLDLSVSQRSGQGPAAPAVSMHVDDVLVWLASTSTRAFHLSFRDTALAVDGPQTRYLTVLALKLIPLITGIVDRFDGIFANNTRRLQWLTYVVTQNGEAVGDPPFMARMLYILRAFPGHFRNTDSWKIFSRLRHILLNLPEKKSDELEAHCRGKSFEFPADAPTKTLESWTEWRNWDVPYVNQTMAFTVLWHSDEPKHEPPSEKPPLTVTFRSESFRISIENGKTRSEVFLEETSLEVENIPPTRPEGLMLVDENTRTKTLIQLHIGTIALNLDWSLVSIAEDVVALNDKIQQASSHLQASGKRTTRQAIDDGLARHDVHIVLSTDAGSISLESINVRHISQAEGLKVSIIGTTRASEQLGQCASVIVNVDRAVTELHGAKSRICQTLLISPSLYVDRVQPASGADIPATVTLALAYEDLQIRITEQLPGIIHLVDSIIVDEVSKCQALAEAVKPRPSSSASASPVLTPQKTKNTIASETTIGSVPPKLHVAVLARNVHLEVSLLQNLGFVLEGVAASVRVAPSLANDKMFGLDFDIGQQKHAFVNTSEDERHIQGLLDVPPINGHVGLELSHDETSVSITTTIEKVEVDAGAIQGVIGVVNRPEVQEVFKSIKAGIEDIQHHVHEVFPKRGVDKPKPVKEQRITFDARVALLGIRVSAETPTARDAHRYRATAEVEFGIGPFHVTASNRDTSKDANPLIPEVRAYIQDLGAALRVRERGRMRPCGNATMSIRLHFNNTISDGETVHRELKVQSDGIEINANPETASTVVDVINHLDDRIRHLDLSKEVEYLRRLRDERRQTVIKRIKGKEGWTDDDEMPFSPEDLLSITTTIELTDIQASWLVDQSFAAGRGAPVEDLVFSIASIEFKTRGGHEARLNIQNIQLQLAQREESKQRRALNSALLPEVGFSVAYWSEKGKNIQLAFKATGKPLDLRLESTFILAVSAVQRSIELARDRFKNGTATWQSTPTASGAPRRPGFDTKRLSAVRMEADFAGAQVHIHGSGPQSNSLASIAAASQQHGTQHGAYGQFAADGALMQTTLTAPGIALKVEYNRDELQPRLNGELMIDASSNMLAPNVAPLVLEISNSVKEVMRSQEKEKPKPKPKPPPPATSESTGDGRPDSDHPRTKPFFEDDNIVATTPARIFGKTKVDLGFRIAKQEFGLSCQPIARVDAKASLEDFYITMNTIDSDEHGHFFAMSAVMTKLTAQVKHMYSREPTFSYDMDSIVLSAMNNKHLSGTAGISAILNVNPTKLVINGKQFQDLLLFREIWLPPEIRRAGAAAPAQTPASGATLQRPDEFVVQRYQTLAAAAAFPWNATVNIAELAVDVDLGQSIGKSSFTMTNLWASQQKWSNWEQNLCVGLDEMGVNSTGRMSGFIHLGGLGVRTSIKWPEECAEATLRKTPLIQASVGFKELRAKAAFDYQAFAFGDIGDFDFLMYNVRDQHGQADRLVAVVDCEKAYVFCTSSSASQAVALYQAFDRLIQEKQTAYMQSLREIEKHLRRESTVAPTKFGPTIPHPRVVQKKAEGSPISLHTDVVVTMGAICLGVYPSTFFDSQMLKLEASNIQARFAVGLERGKITSGLGMTLGQLQVALASARRTTAVPQALEIGVDEVIASALNAKGGIILRVPKVVASMQTWQPPKGYDVDFTFKSVFDGKIDVGWNLSRINSIKGMWESGTRALASRLDKSLPQSAVKIKAAGPAADSPSSPSRRGDQQDGSPPPPPAAAAAPQEKITAEINLPQSRYEYHALEPPVIETPQLRDMGEATPPLEWVGLHRDRLPNVTHQIIIVTLLEVCREVEDAYTRILGGAVREAAS